MHEREDKDRRQLCSFRRWLFAPVLDDVKAAKEEVLLAIKKATQDNVLEPGEITKAFGSVTDVINKMAR